MSTKIDQYLDEIEEAKSDIKTSITNKRGAAPSGGLSSYAEAIDDIYIPQIQESKNVTISENGEYDIQQDSGYDAVKNVKLEVDVYIPKSESKEVTINQEGYTYIEPSAGYDAMSSVTAFVDITGEYKTPIPNGFRFTGGDIAQVDFSQYDWSMVYDTSNFFQNCTHSTGDWSNFEENYNGKILTGTYMFYGLSTTSCPNMDTSKMIDAYAMFYNCSNLETVPDLDLSSVYGFNLNTEASECGSMFYNCSNLETVGKLTTPNTRIFSDMFYSCAKLKYIPDIDFDSAVRASRMFFNCPIVGDYTIDAKNCVLLQGMFRWSGGSKTGDLNLSLKLCNDPNSPYLKFFNMSGVSASSLLENNKNLKSLQLEGYIGINFDSCFRNCSNLDSLTFNCDFSKVTNVNYLFQNCTKLESIPDMNLSSVTTFMGTNADYSWLRGCTKLKSIGVIDCDSCTKAFHLVPSSTVLTDLGGFRNLGKADSLEGTNSDYFLYQTPNLTRESLMNVINMLYDRASNGLSTVTIKLHTNHMALLSEEDIAIATNKGWILTV